MTSVMHNGFSGVDIQATYKGKYIGDLQGVRFAVNREPAPIYTMETNPNSQALARGKRRIAGSLVFAQFDAEPIYWDIVNPNDPIPPFDIVMITRNDNGHAVQMKIVNVQLLNNGSEVTPDDIVGEHLYTFVAGGLTPWTTLYKKEDHTGQIYNPITKTWSWF